MCVPRLPPGQMIAYTYSTAVNHHGQFQNKIKIRRLGEGESTHRESAKSLDLDRYGEEAETLRRYSREIARGCGYDVRVIGQLAGTGRSGLQR